MLLGSLISSIVAVKGKDEIDLMWHISTCLSYPHLAQGLDKSSLL
jgi:hypothetical protein